MFFVVSIFPRKGGGCHVLNCFSKDCIDFEHVLVAIACFFHESVNIAVLHGCRRPAMYFPFDSLFPTETKFYITDYDTLMIVKQV